MVNENEIITFETKNNDLFKNEEKLINDHTVGVKRSIFSR